MSVIVALTFCLMSMLALVPAPVAADQPACPFGQRWDAELGRCVRALQIDIDQADPVIESTVIAVEPREDDLPASTETPAEEPDVTATIDIPIVIPTATATETVEPANDNASMVLIDKRSCPVGFDASAASYDDLTASCQDAQNGVVFGVSDGASAIATQTTGDVKSGEVEINGLPSGPLSIYEQIPAGYGAPLVFCGGFMPGESGPASIAQQQVLDGNQIFYLFQPGEKLFCNWFNLPTGDATPGADDDVTVIVNKHACPAGYDSSAADIYQLAADCGEPSNGIVFGVSDGASALETQTTGDVLPSGIQIEHLPAGPLSIYEQVPAGYGAPLVFCDGYMVGEAGPTNIAQQQVLDGNQIFYLFQPGETLYCDWFNLPADQGDDVTVLITKLNCPVGYAASADYYDLAFNCQEPADGVVFGVSDGASAIATQTTGAAGPGTVEFTGLPAGPLSVYEQVPDGYGAPFIFCDGFLPGEQGPSSFSQMQVLDGNQFFYLFEPGETLYCSWYNVPIGGTMDEPGDITIYKWTCPAGYDWMLAGADPTADCTEATNGVTFTLDQPVGVDLQSSTGDAIPGAVSFGGLEPGSYTVTESVPSDTDAVFVLDCTGLSIGLIQPSPLSIGSSLSIELAGGNKVVCNWYNVPADDPDYGQVTVIKHYCADMTFISEIDCEIYEDGVAFDLLGWNGSDWVTVADGVTDQYGKLTWSGLQPGSYVIDEALGEPCYITASYQDGEEHIAVLEDTETVVNVFNCGISSSTQGKPPVKFPNTGVAPSETTAPTAANAPEASACVTESDDDIATPAAACDRGDTPVSITIEAAGVDAEIEVLETVAGEMQAPTGAVDVAWYKESARLGEQGNVVMAGHLNYWGVPEGVFFAIDDLTEGDIITVEGESGDIFTYEVVWVEQIDASESPADIFVETDEPSLTLITCGGEWDPAASEYDHRTVVRAVLVEPEA